MKKDVIRFGYSFFLAIIFFNLLLLNMWVMGYAKPLFQAAKTVENNSVGTNSGVSVHTEIPCGTECVKEIYKAIYTATTSAKTIQYINNPSVVSSQSSAPLQYSVSLGSGINTSTTWTNVAGVQAYINSANYGTIQSVTFQASLYVPTGNQMTYVQLYNVTLGHPVWFSTMSMSGGQPQLLVSNPITLDPGNNLYQVQMMSQLGFATNLVGSSVNIVSN